MFDKSTDHGNDGLVLQFVFLFLTYTILRETPTEMDVKIFNVIVKNKSTTIFRPWKIDVELLKRPL